MPILLFMRKFSCRIYLYNNKKKSAKNQKYKKMEFYLAMHLQKHIPYFWSSNIQFNMHTGTITTIMEFTIYGNTSIIWVFSIKWWTLIFMWIISNNFTGKYAILVEIWIELKLSNSTLIFNATKKIFTVVTQYRLHHRGYIIWLPVRMRYNPIAI